MTSCTIPRPAPRNATTTTLSVAARPWGCFESSQSTALARSEKIPPTYWYHQGSSKILSQCNASTTTLCPGNQSIWAAFTNVAPILRKAQVRLKALRSSDSTMRPHAWKPLDSPATWCLGHQKLTRTNWTFCKQKIGDTKGDMEQYTWNLAAGGGKSRRKLEMANSENLLAPEATQTPKMQTPYQLPLHKPNWLQPAAAQFPLIFFAEV